MVTNTKTNIYKATHKTRQPLNHEIRDQVIPILSHLLADTSDLYFQVKEAHWNVKGENFIALHKLFDDVADDITEYIDEIAERIAQLGGQVHGTLQHASRSSRLPTYPESITTGHDHVDAVSKALAQFSDNARQGIDDTDEFGDPVTADMLTNITGGIDKWLWFIESHNL
ncbi:DNA protection during starvation protein [Poriferisphaera corsica]|uniref:DNA protection during starvation protein n=1 Tax=Poriferisphaera corsica TaxID=2528020 RepID=A0A517YWP5_9BACT|nr:DNA starvation/stationary phase protection protein Dps [Poriferisphaera corsica]QDU34663.1 DNA protection during starvation protein [Poriferisphaera corsica]